MLSIKSVKGLEILDSRGRPTVKAYIELSNGISGAASVPSGASTGKAEAHELRDGDPDRYQGMGCRQAVANINNTIAENLNESPLLPQKTLDDRLNALDGTANKSRLGANAVLAVSLAYARALADNEGIPLYQYLSRLVAEGKKHLPRPTVNLFSGGKHAGGQTPIQDVLIVPLSAERVSTALEQVQRVYQSAVKLIQEKYQSRWLTADEGGLAPPFRKVEDMFQDAMDAISASGLIPGKDIALALDVASSHFYRDGEYWLNNRRLNGHEMVNTLRSWVEKYPIVSLEDGLEEEDWTHWPLLNQAIGRRCLVLGDDLLCTQTRRIQKAMEQNAANALLLKVNQVGTLSEAAAAFTLARQAGWQITVSARSGETEDDWLADLAVAWGGHQIKVGSITQSERLAKYNRLLEIEALTGWPVAPWKSP